MEIEKIGVLIADDQPVVREGLRALIAAQPDMEIVGEASDGIEALEKTRTLCPDVLLLEVVMPRLGGLDITDTVKEEGLKAAVVILSGHEEEVLVYRALRAGALGYVLKGEDCRCILDAIRAVHRGEYCLSARINSAVVRSYLGNGQEASTMQPLELLTAREMQVLRLMVEGYPTAQMAEMLCLSPKTVEKHRTSMMKKLQISDFLSLLKYAIRAGIVEADFWKSGPAH